MGQYVVRKELAANPLTLKSPTTTPVKEILLKGKIESIFLSNLDV